MTVLTERDARLYTIWTAMCFLALSHRPPRMPVSREIILTPSACHAFFFLSLQIGAGVQQIYAMLKTNLVPLTLPSYTSARPPNQMGKDLPPTP